MSFAQRLDAAIDEKRSCCIVGLDPDVTKMPPVMTGGLHEGSATESAAAAIQRFNTLVIDSIHDLVPAVKPQIAFYERYGADGIRALEHTVAHARRRGLMVIMDAKRGDIGSTSTAYADAFLDRQGGSRLASDALTVNPYLGLDTVSTFAETAAANDAGIFVLLKTSNPGSKDIQDLECADGRRVFEHLADRLGALAAAIGDGFEIGVVIGGTYPEHAVTVRKQLPTAIFLVPGFGAQGGDVTRAALFTGSGGRALFSSSRAVLYPHLYGDAAGSQPPPTVDILAAAIRDATRSFVATIERGVGGGR